MIIKLNPTLIPRSFDTNLRHQQIEDLDMNFVGNIKYNQQLRYDDPNNKCNEFQKVENNIPDDADLFHTNYITYLEQCYAKHYTPVVSPDLFWNIIMGELATHVKENDVIYHDTFTTSDEKTDIIIENADLQKISIENLIKAIRPYVPANIDDFLPEFSNPLTGSSLSIMANFLDMVSPYYNYRMYCCGFPRIDLRGTKDDWELLRSTINKISPIFQDHAGSYMKIIHDCIDDVINYFDNPNDELWKNMFVITNCGSGHQTEISGWLTKLYLDEQSSPRYSENFPTNIAKIHYKQLNTNREYDMFFGLFSSKISNEGIMEPSFSYSIAEKNPLYENFDLINN